MRLAFFNSAKSWGGVKTWTLEFAAALQALVHHVHIFGRPGPFVERASTLGLPTHTVSFGPDFNPVTIGRFVSFFKTQHIDAVLVNVGRDIRTAGVAAALCSIPTVHRIGLPRDMRRHWKVRAVHHLVRPHYLCPCAYIRTGLLQALPFIHPKDSTVLLSAKNPMPTPPVRPADNTHKPLIFATTSQLNHDKGHDSLIHALAAMRDKGYLFHWHVAGTGHKELELKALAASLGLESHITWHGFTQNVAAVLAQAQVFVLPSLSEGLPNTLLEAMAHGLVPVARNIGGINEVWPQEAPNLLLPDTGFAPALEAALDFLLTADPFHIHQLRFAAWQKCHDSFSMQIQAPKLEAFFQKLIHKHHTPCA